MHGWVCKKDEKMVVPVLKAQQQSKHQLKQSPMQDLQHLSNTANSDSLTEHVIGEDKKKVQFKCSV